MRKNWMVAVILLVGIALVGNQMVAARMTTTRPAALAEGDEPTLTLAQAEEEVEATSEPPEEKKPEVLTHKISAGETLGEIAARYNTDVTTLMTLNSLASANRLQVGQELKVLTTKGLLHKIASGDTVWDVARKYSLSLETIYAANPGLENNVLRLGQEIILPGAKPVVERAAVASRGTASTSSLNRSNNSSSSSTSSSSSLGFIWPLSGRITSNYGYRWGRLHAGIDIGVPIGTTVKAAAAGRVTYSGWASGYGYLVKIDHGNGYETRYAHNNKLIVSVGQNVSRGQTIAQSGNTGFSTGPHLHFEVRRHGQPMDPRTVLP